MKTFKVKNKISHQFSPGDRRFFTELKRAFKMLLEYTRGYFAFRKFKNCVTVFGSARFDEDHKYYKLAREIGRVLADNKFTVMTGGGAGIMEAANRGAKDHGGISIGCNIEIPQEQIANKYLDKYITFHYFFLRKLMLTKYSCAFIVMPGGFGTLDEFFEMATLIQTGKLKDFPVVLVGKSYWIPLVDFMNKTLKAHNTIADADIDKLLITDDPEQAVEHLKRTITYET